MNSVTYEVNKCMKHVYGKLPIEAVDKGTQILVSLHTSLSMMHRFERIKVAITLDIYDATHYRDRDA